MLSIVKIVKHRSKFILLQELRASAQELKKLKNVAMPFGAHSSERFDTIIGECRFGLVVEVTSQSTIESDDGIDMVSQRAAVDGMGQTVFQQFVLLFDASESGQE